MDENTRTTGDEAPNMLGRRLGIECRVWARDNRAIPPEHRAAIEERMPGLVGRGHWEPDAGGFGLTLDGVEYTGEWKAEKEVLI